MVYAKLLSFFFQHVNRLPPNSNVDIHVYKHTQTHTIYFKHTLQLINDWNSFGVLAKQFQ